ncbi:MAG: penicillin-binding protein 2 [Actinomycetota bacterium]|nr:penicillin-binding protein 2 [Actinomycetota bacterium]
MRKNVRKLGIFFIILTLALFFNLSYIQVFGQQSLRDNQANTRRLREEYGIDRGRIITADGEVAAESVESEGALVYQRFYPLSWLLCHVVGYDSPQFGRSGLEQEYNEYLLGRLPSQGWVEQLTRIREEGFDLYTTVDTGVQRAAAEALGERKGAVMAINPKTGAVLAMYSWPNFDPNALVSQETDAEGGLVAETVMQSYARSSSSPLLNRCSMGLYPPGSSFKVVTSSAGITSGFPVSTEYACPGIWEVGGSRVVNYGSPPKDFGVIDMDTALTLSVNTYFAQLAVDMGGEALVGCTRGFGVNQSIPIDYPSVAVSSIPGPGEMDLVELAWTGAGQGQLLFTPLQLGLIGCGIANGGRVMRLHLMKDIRNGDEILNRYESEVWTEPISSETASQVLEMMKDVVASGTGTQAAIPGVTVAGKTGTAEVGEGMPNHAWFLGIAPAENPQVVVAVIVENSGGGGGSVAAPIAREVIEAALE